MIDIAATPTRNRIDIVMIDDDALMLECAGRALRKSQRSLLTMNDGDGLCEVLASHNVGALVVDYHLTLGTGIELMQALHEAQARLPEVLVLATASQPPPFVQTQATELGMRIVLKNALLDRASLEALLV